MLNNFAVLFFTAAKLSEKTVKFYTMQKSPTIRYTRLFFFLLKDGILGRDYVHYMSGHGHVHE